MTITLSETASFKALKEQFSGEIILSGAPTYEARATTFSVKGTPAAIFQPQTPQDIALVISYATDHGLALSVRSGGHSVAGFSTNNGGLVLDLARLNSIEVLNEATGLVRLGSGALWGDVALKLAEHQLAISSGDTKTVGVGGLTLGGGIGWMVRKYGFAIDSLVAAEVVLADGSVVHASETENDDLFWAVRGGGGNFGVVTSFDFLAHSQGQIVASTITYGADDLQRIIIGWRDYMRSATEDLTSFMTLMPGFATFPPRVMIMSCYAGDDEATANTVIDPLRKLGNPISDDTGVKAYAEMLHEPPHPPQGVQFIVKNMFTKVLNDELVAALSDVCCKPGGPMVQLRMMNGAADKVDNQATAVAHRGNEAFLYASFPTPFNATEEQIAKGSQSWEKLAVYSSGTYSNFLSTNSASDIAGIYPNVTYERLAKIKRQYDPENIFNHNFNITPAKV